MGVVWVVRGGCGRGVGWMGVMWVVRGGCGWV